jgi:arginase family enzyme
VSWMIGEVRAAAERLMEAFSTGDVDSGVSFRPGARFGPHAVRQASRMLRPQFHPIHEMEPFAILQGADAGDIACNPFDIMESIGHDPPRFGGPASGIG